MFGFLVVPLAAAAPEIVLVGRRAGWSVEVSDYELASSGGRRVLKLTFKKENPYNVVVWWARALVGEEESDTMAFPDRRAPEKATENANVWAEATRMFQEKIAKREKIMVDASGVVDVGGADGAGGGEEEEEEEEEGGGGGQALRAWQARIEEEATASIS